MSDHPSARTFISYSRNDGAEVAGEIRDWLLKEGLSVWQDLITLEGGRDWWSQIEDALKSKNLQHFVLIVTPGALASPVIRREIRLARQEGKTVCPVRGPSLGDLGKLPRWLGQIYDLNLPEHRTTLVRVLQDQSRQQRVAMMAPDPPADFVERPVEFNALKRRLLDSKGDAIAITAALRGAGGYGKTTLAKALAYDLDIQDAFLDGILWVELGEQPSLLSIISDLVEILSGDRPGLENLNAATAKLSEALGHRRILLIVDDAWRERDLRPFLQGGNSTTRLITTRRDDILPHIALRQAVDAMQDPEALALLAGGLPQEEIATQRDQLGKLAARLGEWALLLKLVNGFLRDRVTKKQPLAQAIAGVNQRLDEKGLLAFDARDEVDRTNAVARTIGVSLDLLDNARRARFGELAAFPEDADIPIGIVGQLWADTGGFDAADTEDFLNELYDLSLLLGLDFDQRTARLHDTVRHFLQGQTGKQGLVGQHKRLLQSLEAFGASTGSEAATRRYYYLWLLYHLAEAGQRERLDALLLDPAWLHAKLTVTGSPQTLIDDYRTHGAGEAQSLIERTLRLVAGICSRDPRQLIPQLLGRLGSSESRVVRDFLADARRKLTSPAILTQQSSLTPPGAEIARLEGHSDWIAALCELPDGRLASASADKSIRLWNLHSGDEAVRLGGHQHWVRTLCIVDDGRLASGSWDRTVRLWDVETGIEAACLRGHLDLVASLCLLPDGCLASGSTDKTIRLWDVNSGTEIARLEGHLGSVDSLCVLPDGRLVSGSDDGTIRLWDVKAGAEVARLDQPSGKSVAALCVLPDGRLAAISQKAIRIWDVNTAAEVALLEGHLSTVRALTLLPNNRLASGSHNRTIRIWDVTSAQEVSCVAGHSGSVSALCTLRDGRLASGANDKSVRLWDVNSPPASFHAVSHSQSVTAMCLLPNGQLASGSSDKTIRMWDVKTGVQTAIVSDKADRVGALCVIPGGLLASASVSKTIRLWDPTSGALTAVLSGHVDSVRTICVLSKLHIASGSADGTIRLWDIRIPTVKGDPSSHPLLILRGNVFNSGPVHAICPLPDGKIAAGSDDGTIGVWDPKNGTHVARLIGHRQSINCLCILSDGRLASGSGDSVIKLWDVQAGLNVANLSGHSGSINALCELGAHKLALCSSDHTVRVWDIARGLAIACLEVDAAVQSLAALDNRRFVAGDQLGRLHWLEVVN